MSAASIGKLAAIVPAAGASHRFGEPKQLLRMGNQTLVRRCVQSLASSCDPIVVVVGAVVDEVVAELPVGCIPQLNPDWPAGLGLSLACGVDALPAGCDAVLIALPDQPLVTAANYTALARRWRASPQRIVCARYSKTLGAPAIFPRRLFRSLRKLNGDTGARAIIANDGHVTGIPMPEAAVDIDTAADARRAGLKCR